jgi:hypothetical protein
VLARLRAVLAAVSLPLAAFGSSAAALDAAMRS